jgi:hypothetical protein
VFLLQCELLTSHSHLNGLRTIVQASTVLGGRFPCTWFRTCHSKFPLAGLKGSDKAGGPILRD